MLCGAFLSVLNQTLVVPALPAIMLETGVSATTAQWLVSGFTLVNAIVIAISAFLMDRFPTKKLFIAIFVLFLAGSLLAAWGYNFGVLLAGRVLQAVCAGVMLPFSTTILLLVFPYEKRGSAMGMMSLIIMFAPAIGPVVSGVLTDNVGWRFMFLIMAALAVVVIVSAAVSMKNFGRTKDVSLDKLSITLSSAGLFLLLYAFSVIGHAETLPMAVVMIAGAAVALTLFARRQLKSDRPFLRIRVLANKRFRVGTIITMIIMVSLTAATITIPIYVQTVRGLSATLSGTVMMPGALVGALCGYFAGRLYDRFGARAVSVTGVALVAAGSAAMMLFDFDTSAAFITVSYAVRSAGLMLANTPINIWSLSELDDEVLHHGNAVSSTLRQTAATLGTAGMISAMTLSATWFASRGEAESQLVGILTTYFLSLLVAMTALIMVLVYVKKPLRRPSTSVKSYELDAVMLSDPYTASCDETLEQVVEKFIKFKTRGLPVVDREQHVVGFISDGDVLKLMSKHNVLFEAEAYSLVLPDEEGFFAKGKNLLGKNVMDIASKHVITASRDTPLFEVCRIFIEKGMNKLPVTQDDVLVGTISRGDIMRTLMKRLPIGGG
jgi:EmrB/QacA subfamily drug resistance transporter